MEQTFIPSDVRIKECICPLKGLLCKLDQINFVSYDRIGKESRNCDVGILAQDIVNIFPNMVSLKNDYLPNIQQTVEHTLMTDDIVSIRMTNTLPLKEKDDILCLIKNATRTQPYFTTIMNATEDSIEIKKWEEYSPTDELFLHGTMVDDYHRVDIGQVGVLGAACAKELYHMVKCQADQIAALNGTCTALQQQLNSVLARLP